MRRLCLPLCALLCATLTADDRLGPAKELLSARSYEQAATTLTELLREELPPEVSAEARYLYLHALALDGRHEQVVLEADVHLRALDGSPWQHQGRFLLAESYLALKRFSDTSAILREEIARIAGADDRSELAGLYETIADEAFEGYERGRAGDALDSLRREPDYERALRFYARASEIYPGPHPRTAFYRALSAKKLGRPEALELLRGFVDGYPDDEHNAEAAFHAGELLSARGAWRDARDLLGRVPATREEYPRAVELLGLGHIAEGRLERGIALWAALVAEQPARGEELAYRIGRTHYDHGRYEEAQRAWRAAIAAYPESERAAEAAYSVAYASFALGRFADARRALSDFLGSYPNNGRWVEAQELLATSHISEGEQAATPAAAIAAWRRFVDAYPVHARIPEVLLRIAEAQKQLPDLDAARATWRSLAAKFPRSAAGAEGQWLLANSHEQAGELATAVAALRTLIAGFPGTNQAWLASQRLREIEQQTLEVVTPRVFASDESLEVQIRSRNLESLRFKLYRVDLLTFFEKKQTWVGVEQLAVDIVEPAQSWEQGPPDYEPYALREWTARIGVDTPGAWLLQVEGERFKVRNLLLQSDLDMVVKVSPGQTLVFCLNRRTGEVWPGAEVLQRAGGKLLPVANTGDDGVLLRPIEAGSGEVLSFASHGEHIAFASSAASRQASSTLSAKGYVFSERPVYRPGQEVHLKAFVRSERDGSYHNPAGEEVSLIVKDARNTALMARSLVLDPFGAVDASLQLDAEAPVGRYAVELRLGKLLFTGDFEVEAYRKPAFQVLVGGPATARPGDTLEFLIDARYLFGGPVADAEVEYRCFQGTYTFDGSRYQDFAWFANESARRTPSYDFLLSGRGRTDAEGRLRVQLPSAALEVGRVYVCSAEVRDVDRRFATGTGSSLVTPQAFFAVLRADRKLVRADQPLGLSLKTVDAAHAAVSAEGRLEVIRVRAGGVEERSFELPAATDERGDARLSVSIPTPGDYILRYLAEDARGQLVKAEARVAVSGDDERKAEARVLADKKVYREGEEAAVLIASPVTGTWGLLCFEAEQVLEYRLVRLDDANQTLRLPMRGAYAPNFALSLAIPGRDTLYEASDEIHVIQSLDVEVRADLADYAPGETAVFTIRTRDLGGNGVPAQLSFALVDEAVYQIAADATEDIRAFFYDARRGRAVGTAGFASWSYAGRLSMLSADVQFERAKEEYERELEERLGRVDAPSADFEADDALGGGGGAAGAYGQRFGRGSLQAEGGSAGRDRRAAESFAFDPAAPPAPPPPPPPPALNAADEANAAPSLVRRRFADTALWAARVTTDAEGRAVLRVPLPHNLTRWRATLRGATQGSLFGQALGGLRTSQPVSARLSLPRFLVAGDNVRVGAVLHNQTARALTAELQLEAEGFELVGGRRSSERIEGHSRALVELEARASAPGAGLLRAELRSDEGGDAVERPLPILPRGVEVRDGKTLLVAGSDRWSAAVPETALPGSARLHVRLFPGEIAFLRQAVSTLEHFPYSCVEQTVNRFLPALALARAAERLGAADEDARRRLEQLVEAGVARLLALQHDNGGFGWWRQGPHDPLMTGYALLGLGAARDFGVFVDNRAIDRARTIAAQQLDRVGPDVAALLVYAIGESGKPSPQQVARVYRQVTAMAPAGLALMALACQRAERPEYVEGLVGMLMRAAERAEGRLSWSGGGGFSGVEATGLGLLALSTTGARAELREAAARWLREQALGEAWASTRDTAAAVQGLCAQLVEAHADATPLALTLQVEHEGPALTVREPGTTWERTCNDALAELPVEGAFRVVVDADVGAPRIAVELRYLVAPEDAVQVQEQLTITRRYEPFQEAGGWTVVAERSRPETPSLEALTSGAKMWVVLELRCEDDLAYVEIADGVPAGCEISSEDASGPFTRMEARDERAVFFAPSLPRGTHVIRYQVRGILPGSFLALPARARPMYVPALEARSAVADFSVLDVEDAPEPARATPDARYAALGRAVREQAWSEVLGLCAELLALDLRPEIRLTVAGHRLSAAQRVGTAEVLIEAFEDFAARKPDDPRFDDLDLLLDLATAYVEQGEDETALSFYRRLFEGYRQIDVQLVQVYDEIDRPHRAQERWRETLFRFPASSATAFSWFGWAQRFAALEARDGTPMRAESFAALTDFIALHPGSKLCARAQLARAEVLYALGEKRAAGDEAVKLEQRYPTSDRLLAAQQLATRSWFEDGAFDAALEVGTRLLASADKHNLGPGVWHIFAQIHHIRGELEAAVEAYRKARGIVDAEDALAFLTEQRLGLPDLVSAPAGRDLTLDLRWKNLTEVEFLVYRVDLPMLLTEELDLAELSVDLTGIPSELEERRALRPAERFRWHEAEQRLPVSEKGVYLIVAKSDAGDRSTVALLGDLQLEVQRTGGRSRVYVTSRATGAPVEGVYLRISDGNRIAARGTTDARGIFETNAHCQAVVASSEDGDYAVWR